MKSSKEEIVAFLEKEFTQSLEHCTIESVTSKAAVVYYHV
ncbi:thioesterase, partial [Acinetobacter baumannii]